MTTKQTTLTPDKTIYEPRRKTTRAIYSDRPQHEFYMRGGVCWPYAQYMGVRASLQGYAVLCGQDVRTGAVYVLKHTGFKTIDPMIHPKTQMVINPGLSPWLNKCWQQWYCRKYFWHDLSATSLVYRAAVSRSEMCQPKPSFPEAKWQDDDSARATLYAMAMEGQFFADEELMNELMKPENMEAKLHPLTHAIVCALVGLNKHPWREPRARREDVLRI